METREATGVPSAACSRRSTPTSGRDWDPGPSNSYPPPGSGSLGTKWPGGGLRAGSRGTGAKLPHSFVGEGRGFWGANRNALADFNPSPARQRPPAPPQAPPRPTALRSLGSHGHSPSSSACTRSGAHRANSSARTFSPPAPAPMAPPGSRPAGWASRTGPAPPLPAWGSLLRGPARRGHPAPIFQHRPRQREGVSAPPRPAHPSPR